MVRCLFLFINVVVVILVIIMFELRFGLGVRNGGRLNDSVGLSINVICCCVMVLSFVIVKVI